LFYRRQAPEIVDYPRLTGVETSHPKLIFGNIPVFGDGGEAHFGLYSFRSSKSAKDVKNPGQSGVLAAADGSQLRMMFLNPCGDSLKSGLSDPNTPASETIRLRNTGCRLFSVRASYKKV
jgi:hypothetical protein